MWQGREAFAAAQRLVSVAEAVSGTTKLAWRQGVLRLAQSSRQDSQLRAAALDLPYASYVPASQLSQVLPGMNCGAAGSLGGLMIRDGISLDTGRYLEALWSSTRAAAAAAGGSARLHTQTKVCSLHDLDAMHGPYNGMVLAMGAGLLDLGGVQGCLPGFMDLVSGVSLVLEAVPGDAGEVPPAGVGLAAPSTGAETAAGAWSGTRASPTPWPEGAPCLASMPYIAAQGPGRCVVGATWERPAVPDQDTGTAPRDEAELLATARALWPPLRGWSVTRRAQGTRVVAQRTHEGTQPYAGRLELDPQAGLPPVWLVSGLGARGILYHAWLGELTAAGVLSGDESHLPPALLRWKGAGSQR